VPQIAATERAFFKILDLVERWGVSRTTIYKEIERGRLKRKHIGGQVRFAAADVAEYERLAG
jgi:excisionase family DNA binding protein